MSAFPWVDFLRHRGIEFIERGANVARGHVNIQCPFCGPRDHSQHMGLQLSTGYWGCWRDSKHRGKNPVRLLMALVHCSLEEAKKLVEEDKPMAGSLSELRAKLDKKEEEQLTEFKAVQWPKEFFPVAEYRNGMRGLFRSYLEDRGFPDARKVARDYALRGCLGGKFSYRLIFPLHFEGKLVGWTGRSIRKALLRYVTDPPGELTNHLLIGYDGAKEKPGHTLVLVEGPVDWLKIDHYGKVFGFRCVGLLGTHLSEPKLRLLSSLVPLYQRVLLLLDPDALGRALGLQERLRLLGKPVGVLQLPAGAEDPGALSPRGVRKLLLSRS